jgi:hypothetical protein
MFLRFGRSAASSVVRNISTIRFHLYRVVLPSSHSNAVLSVSAPNNLTSTCDGLSRPDERCSRDASARSPIVGTIPSGRVFY